MTGRWSWLPPTLTPGDDVAAMGHGVRHRRRRLVSRFGMADRGAALVEFAILAPLLVLLLIGGVDLALATVDRFQLQAIAQTCADSLAEDECGNHAGAAGASLMCFQAAAPHCHDDGLTLPRITVTVSKTLDPILLPGFTVSASATGRVEGGG